MKHQHGIPLDKLLPGPPTSREWIVYVHTHRESGQKYVGITTTSKKVRDQWYELSAEHAMLHRWQEHIYASKAKQGVQRYFMSALRTHGNAAFDHAVLQTGIHSAHAASEAEREWIKRLQCRAPQGFNCDDGGLRSEHSVAMDPGTCAKIAVARKKAWERATPQERAQHIEKLRVAHALRTPEQMERLQRALLAITKEERHAIALRARTSRSEESIRELVRLGVEANAKRRLALSAEARAQERERLSGASKQYWNSRTPEQRSDFQREQWTHKTPAQRSEISRARNAAMTPEKKSARATKFSKTYARKTPQERSVIAAKIAKRVQSRRALYVPKPCRFCAQPIHLRPGERPACAKKRKYCSRKCVGLMRKKNATGRRRAVKP